MKRLDPVFVLVVIALVGCSRPEESQVDVHAIRDVIHATATANNSGDVDGWVALFEQGAVYMPPGQRAVTTRQALHDAATAGFSSWRSSIQIKPEEIMTSGDWAFARTQVSGEVTPRAGGDPLPIDIKQLVVYHRQLDGSWKIARLIGNSNTQ